MEETTKKTIEMMGIYELRTLARNVGVPSPNTLKRQQLLEAIYDILDGVKEATPLKKVGRPPKKIKLDTSVMDVFVPQDTTGVTSYLIEVGNKGLLRQYCFQYTDHNRAKLSEFEDEEALLDYLKKQNIMEQFVRFAAQKGVKRRNLLINKSRKLLEKNLYGNIIYNIQGIEPYIRYINQSDATVLKALEILEKGEAFPKAPEEIADNETENNEQERTAQVCGRIKNPARGFHYASVC